MSGNIKINPDVASGVARNFSTQAQALTDIIGKLQSDVTANVGGGKPGWEGRQADEFVNSWNGDFKPALTKLVDALGQGNELLSKTIAAYQQLDGN
jgi:WXG100 family type VII secretion target